MSDHSEPSTGFEPVMSPEEALMWRLGSDPRLDPSGGLSFLGAFNDLLLYHESNDTAAAYVRQRIVEIVEDPATREVNAFVGPVTGVEGASGELVTTVERRKVGRRQTAGRHHHEPS